jgi:peroxiredoxin
MPSLNARSTFLVAGFALLGLAMALLIFGNVLFGVSSGADENSGDAPILQQVPEFTEPEVGVAGLNSGGGDLGDLIEVGDAADDFSLNDLDGNLVTLSDFRGRPVMLNFWATWCLPCRVEMPELQQALHDYQDENLVVLAINQQESPEAVEEFFEEFDLSLTPLLDSEGTVGQRYRMLNLPGTVFINPDGQITAIHRGILAREQIDEYLAETIPSGG